VKNRVPSFDPASEPTSQRFKALFEVHLKLEQEAENLRQRLAKAPEFRMHEAFSQLDEWRRTFLTQEDLRRFLQQKGEFLTPTHLRGLMDRYDRDRDGRITYSEFIQEIQPKSPEKPEKAEASS
jgi:Ca2+-binding EF-hand superfamily protein